MSSNAVKSLIYTSLPWVLSAALLVASFITAICFRGTDSFLFFPSLGGVILIGFMAIWPGFKKGLHVPRSYLLVFVGLYWAHILASISWSVVTYNSTLFALIFSLLPFIFLVFVIAPNRDRLVVLYLCSIGAVMTGLAVWALIQFVFLLEEYGPRIRHPMLNPNNLAVLFNMSLFMALALYFQQKKRLYVALSYILVLLFFMALMTTQSRGATLCLAIAIIPFVALVCKNKGFTWRRVLFLLIGGTLFMLLINGVSSVDLAKNIPLIPKGDNSIVDRQLLWGSTWEMIKDNFWLGTGLGTFYYYYPHYRQHGDMSDGFFSHMDPLQFWAEIGVFSPVLFYAVLIGVFGLTVKAVRASAADNPQRLWLMASFCALLVLIGHSHISFHLYMPAPLIIAGFIMAFWYGMVDSILGGKRVFISKDNNILFKLFARSAVIMVFLAAISWMGLAASGIYFAGKADSLMTAGKKEEGINNVILAERYSPSNWYRGYSMQMQLRINSLSALKRAGKLDERKVVYEEALEYSNKARRANPAHTNLWNSQAWLYFYAYPDIDPEGRDKAVALLNETLIANPLLVEARVGLASMYENMGEYRRALAVLETGLTYPMPFGQSTLNLYSEIARYRKHLGDHQGAYRAMQQLVAFKERYKGKF